MSEEKIFFQSELEQKIEFDDSMIVSKVFADDKENFFCYEMILDNFYREGHLKVDVSLSKYVLKDSSEKAMGLTRGKDTISKLKVLHNKDYTAINENEEKYHKEWSIKLENVSIAPMSQAQICNIGYFFNDVAKRKNSFLSYELFHELLYHHLDEINKRADDADKSYNKITSRKS